MTIKKTARNTQASWLARTARATGAWLVNGWTALSTLVIALVAGAESAWAGSRLLMAAGLHWYEGAGIVGTLDLMMITSAFRMRRKGISEVQRNISRAAMWYGLGLSAATNVLSALVYTGIVDIKRVGPWVVVAYSPVVVVTLWFVVEMLTHQSKSASQSALPLLSKAKPVSKAHRPDDDLTPEELAKRVKARDARNAAKQRAAARKAEIAQLEASLSEDMLF